MSKIELDLSHLNDELQALKLFLLVLLRGLVIDLGTVCGLFSSYK